MTILVSHHADGHRREAVILYAAIFLEIDEPILVARSAFKFFIEHEPIFYLMIEDAPFEFFAVAITRALFGLRTAGYLFRPGECLRPTSDRLRLKRLLLRILKILPGIAVITLLPEAIEPKLREIVRYTTYDPQLWDLPYLPIHRGASSGKEILDCIATAANGRRVLMALGLQDRLKGFDYLCQVWQSSESLRNKWLFVVAGRVNSTSRESAASFVANGGLLIDRYVSDSELRSLYQCADRIWTCYAPGYDQASGIFSRAVQFDKPVAVRAGTYLEKLATHVACPGVALPWNDPAYAAEILLSTECDSSRGKGAKTTEEMRALSIRAILEALNLQPASK